MSTKTLELNFAPGWLPSTLEILETAKDRFVLTGESLASLTESQLKWLQETVSINGPDHQKLDDFRTDLIRSIDEDLLSMKTLHINSMGDTDTVYSEINPIDDSIFDKEMPDVLSYFNGWVGSALEKKCNSVQRSSNFLRTNIILAMNDSVEVQDKGADMILPAPISRDNFKSNFFEFFSKNLLEKNPRSKTNKNKKKDIGCAFMIVGSGRLVRCCLTDGSILKDYTSMLFDTKRPTGIPVEMWEVVRPTGPEDNQINDIAATSDHKWLFAACDKGWWAMFDVEQGKIVSRRHCTILEGSQVSTPTSVAVSPNDQLLYMVTDRGTVESYDIQAAKIRQVNSIPNEFFMRITVDPNNQFVFIASKTGELYKYDTGQTNLLEKYEDYGVAANMVNMLLTRGSHYLFFGSGDPNNPKQINKFSVNKKEVVEKFQCPVFERGVASMALSPDSKSLYFGTRDKLLQFCLKTGKVIQSRNLNNRREMRAATIYAMRVTSNNQYLVTGTAFDGSPEKPDHQPRKVLIVGGRVCVWSTKDLTLVKTQDVDTNKLFITRII